MTGPDCDALRRAAGTFGTPLFLYDQSIQRARYRTLRQHVPGQVAINYAMKANGALALSATFQSLGAGVDVCTTRELVTAIAAGFQGRDVLYTGAAKTVEDLRAAVEGRVARIAVESVGEARCLNRIAEQAGHTQHILVRVHEREGAGPGGKMRFASDKFGFTEEGLIADLPALQGLRHLRIDGLLYHTESCVMDHDALIIAQRAYLQSARRIASAGLEVEHVDLGGGIGIPYQADEAPFDMESYGRELTSLLAEMPSHWTYALDPGRYLIGEAGALCLSVVDVRVRNRRRWILTDGGLQVLNRPRFREANAFAGALVEGAVPCALPTSVAGPILTPDDVLIDDIELPVLQAGDLLWIGHVGAYGYAHGLQGFCLSRPAAEAVQNGSEIGLIRDRPAPSRVLEGQHLVAQRRTAPCA